MISVGDLQPRRPLQEELKPILHMTDFYFVHGNHDTDTESYRHLFETWLSDRNLHGRVVQIGGVRFAGCGGVFREEVWSPPPSLPARIGTHERGQFLRYADYLAALRRKTPPRTWSDDPKVASRVRRHLSTIFPSTWTLLSKMRADVLICHEAPSCHPHGFYAIDLLARSMRVKTVFHGHHHDRLDYSEHEKHDGFRTFGVGLCGITALDGTVIRPGDLDGRRTHPQRGVP